MAAGQFDVQTLFAHSHRPDMVGGKDGFEQEGQVLEERFPGADFPVIRDVDEIAVLLERPDAAPDEVAPCLDGEPVRVGVGHAELPAQGVGEPAFGVKVNDAPNAGFGIARDEFFDAQVDGRPPANQVGGVSQDVGDFFDRTLYAPVGDEVVVV